MQAIASPSSTPPSIMLSSSKASTPSAGSPRPTSASVCVEASHGSDTAGHITAAQRIGLATPDAIANVAAAFLLTLGSLRR